MTCRIVKEGYTARDGKNTLLVRFKTRKAAEAWKRNLKNSSKLTEKHRATK